jgi:hypothetical protein
VLGARPELKPREAPALEELIIEYEDIFTTKTGAYGRTDKVYHQIDTSDARPTYQTPCRLPSAKQAKMNDMLEDMKGRGVIEGKNDEV